MSFVSFMAVRTWHQETVCTTWIKYMSTVPQQAANFFHLISQQFLKILVAVESKILYKMLKKKNRKGELSDKVSLLRFCKITSMSLNRNTFTASQFRPSSPASLTKFRAQKTSHFLSNIYKGKNYVPVA